MNIKRVKQAMERQLIKNDINFLFNGENEINISYRVKCGDKWYLICGELEGNNINYIIETDNTIDKTMYLEEKSLNQLIKIIKFLELC